MKKLLYELLTIPKKIEMEIPQREICALVLYTGLQHLQ
jgi:hypothetical protein